MLRCAQHDVAVGFERIVLVLLLVLVLEPVHAADHVLLVAGHGGEPQYTQQFTESLQTIRDALVNDHEYDAAHVTLLIEGDAANTRDRLLQEFNRIAQTATPDDTFLLILMGHGQSDYQQAKFNLPGPDLDAETLREAVAQLPMADTRIVLSFPCSGQFSGALAGMGAAIVASTDGPRQLYHSETHRYLVKAFSDDWTDRDDNGRVTVQELYAYLSEMVDDFFEANEFLQTENVSLEDNGDGRVTTTAEGMDGGDGERAGSLVLLPAPGGGVGDE